MSPPPPRQIRIAVADDHPVVREGLVAMLETQPDFEVVGEAGSGPEAIEMVVVRGPDVLLVDLEMPGLDGVGVLRRLRETQAHTRAIVFTVFDTDERILSAVEAGAAGYLLKG
ncbi:MAG: response regulator, partial [Gemmatimonadaceae bacterium]